MKKLIILISLWFCFSQTDLLCAETKKQRIISLAPSTTEILFALGLNDEIIAVSSFCDYPGQVLTKEKIGSFSQPDIEKIIFLKPDIIFATGLEQAQVVQQLKELNLKVYVSDPASLKELFASLKEIGKLTAREKEAEEVVNKMRMRIEKVKLKSAAIPREKRPKVFIEIWHEPLMTAGGCSFVDELVSLAGGINIAHSVPRAYSYFSAEEVIKSDPDCILLGYMGDKKPNEMVKQRMGWNKIKAVRNGRIYNDINPDLYLRPGPRLADGLEEIQQKLYP
jgi:iron complex transport system substrate-binding protein